MSEDLFARAKLHIPGGVNSPVRAFRAVGGSPLFIESGEGPYVTCADGRVYVDYLGSWGPLILGHAHPKVVAAVVHAVRRGTSFGAPCLPEVELAELIARNVPSIEKVRMVNSGTEATLSALRLARGVTGRSKVVKFSGCYHGHVDALLAEAGSGVAEGGHPGTPGVPPAVTADTIVLPYNDIAKVTEAFSAAGSEIACVIVEPVAGNMGIVPPEPGFLEALRTLTQKWGALLIFDEVITGFRLGLSGAQGYFGVTPDLTCLGKVIGGGLPVGAYGGSSAIMDELAPDGPVYQAGTLSGNPLAMAAGHAQLRFLEDHPETYDEIDDMVGRLAGGLLMAAQAFDIPVALNRVGTLFTLFFKEGQVLDFEGALASNGERYRAFFQGMLESGIYYPPSPMEAVFVSAVHTTDLIELTLQSAYNVFASLKA